MLNRIMALFRKKPKNKPKTKEYIFVIDEGCWVGERYRYTIEADSKKEAGDIFLRFMFGNQCYDKVKSEHWNVTRPSQEVLSGRGNISFRNLSKRSVAAMSSGQPREIPEGGYDELNKILEEFGIERK